MSAELTLEADTAEDVLNAIADRIEAGSGPGVAKVYDGVTLLVTIPLDDPIGVVSGHTLTISAGPQAVISATGTADTVIFADSDDNDVATGTVTTTSGGGALELNSVDLEALGTAEVTGGTISA